jgi:hypothetical protein
MSEPGQVACGVAGRDPGRQRADCGIYVGCNCEPSRLFLRTRHTLALHRHDDNVTGVIAIEPRVAERWVSLSQTSCRGLNAWAFCMHHRRLPKTFSSWLRRLLLGMDLRSFPPPCRRFLVGLRLTRRASSPRSFPSDHLGSCPVSPAAVEGGLISYGTDIAQSFAQAASYIDRVLKGKPADLLRQPSSRNDLVLNLNTATAIISTPPRRWGSPRRSTRCRLRTR